MTEPLDVRLVVQVSRSELAAIEDYQFGNRITGRSEATRQLIRAGLASLDGTDTLEPAPVVPEDATPPTIPEPDAIGRPVLAEVILPWLRAQGRRTYTAEEVVDGVFGETANAPGRRPAVVNVFKAIGWDQRQQRDGRAVVQTFTAPDGGA